ncbi:Imm49 family immunity protein, partial [Marinomonas epiphytica]
IDQQFYLALAKGDLHGMEAAIKELVSPRKMNHRKEWDSSAFMQGLVVPSALKYSKLAIRHGYELDIDSPNLPKEWLPVKPLERYEDEFDFMKAYSI